MATVHTREHHHPATEAALWLVWVAARTTGLAAVARLVGRVAARVISLMRHLAGSDLAQWIHTICADLRATAGHRGRRLVRRVQLVAANLGRAVSHGAHRLVIRAELAAADLLTGPAPALLDVVTARLRRRAGWLLVVGLALFNLLYLYLATR